MKNSVLTFYILLFFISSLAGASDCPSGSKSCKPSSSKINKEKRQSEAYRNKKKSITYTSLNSDQESFSNGKLIIKDVEIFSDSSDWDESENLKGAIVIEAGREVKEIVLDNVTIHTTSGGEVSSKSMAPLIIKSDDASKIKLHDVRVNGKSITLKNIKNSNTECVGMLCIQSPNTTIELDYVDIKSSGESNFEIE